MMHDPLEMGGAGQGERWSRNGIIPPVQGFPSIPAGFSAHMMMVVEKS